MAMGKKKNRIAAGAVAALIAMTPFFVAVPTHAATLEQEWSKNVGTGDIDQVLSMTKTTDGGYVVGGYSNADVAADQGQNYMLAKLDADGNQLWLVHMGGSVGFDEIHQVIETSDGGLAIVGDTAGGMGTGGTIAAGGFVLKLDAAGNEEWGTNVGVNVNDHFNGIVQTTDGGYVVVGSTNGDLGNGTIGSYDGAIIKLDANGDKVWSKNIGTESQESLNALIQTADGGFVAVGTVLDMSTGDFPTGDGLIIKVDGDGNPLWQKIVGTPQEDRINDVANSGDGGFVVAGMTAGDVGSGYLGNEDGMVLKFDKDGNQIWGQNIGTNSSDLINSIIQTADGGYAVAGMTYGDLGDGNKGSFDGLLVKLDDAGKPTWSMNLGTDQFDQIFTVVETDDGGYAVAGCTAGGLSNGNLGQDDGFVIKLSILKHTVAFESNGGSSVDSQIVCDGDKAAKPSDSTQGGYTFQGWFTDKELTHPYDFSTAVTQDITLYAKWTKVTHPSQVEDANKGESDTTGTAGSDSQTTTPETGDPGNSMSQMGWMGLLGIGGLTTVSMIALPTGKKRRAAHQTTK